MYNESITFEKIENVRDLGGMPTKDGHEIKPGMLFRGATPENASANDIKHFDDLGIRYIIDLRNITEFEEGHASDDFNVKLLSFPLNYNAAKGITHERKTYDEYLTDYAESTRENEFASRDNMAKFYANYVAEEYCRNIMREILLFIKDADGPVYWHCAGGKDRTGIISLMLEEILGMAHETIVNDYLFSNECKKEGVKRMLKHVREMYDDDEEYRLRENVISYTWYAHEFYIDTFYKAIETNYGDMAHFLTEGLGIDEKMQQAFKDKFLK